MIRYWLSFREVLVEGRVVGYEVTEWDGVAYCLIERYVRIVNLEDELRRRLFPETVEPPARRRCGLNDDPDWLEDGAPWA